MSVNIGGLPHPTADVRRCRRDRPTEQEQAAVWPERLDGQDARPHRELAAQVLPQSAE